MLLLSLEISKLKKNVILSWIYVSCVFHIFTFEQLFSIQDVFCVYLWDNKFCSDKKIVCHLYLLLAETKQCTFVTVPSNEVTLIIFSSIMVSSWLCGTQLHRFIDSSLDRLSGFLYYIFVNTKKLCVWFFKHLLKWIFLTSHRQTGPLPPCLQDPTSQWPEVNSEVIPASGFSPVFLSTGHGGRTAMEFQTVTVQVTVHTEIAIRPMEASLMENPTLVKLQ